MSAARIHEELEMQDRLVALGAWWATTDRGTSQMVVPAEAVVNLLRDLDEAPKKDSRDARIDAVRVGALEIYEYGAACWAEGTTPIPEEELARWERETGEHRDSYPLDPDEYWAGVSSLRVNARIPDARRALDRLMGWEPPSEDSTGVWA